MKNGLVCALVLLLIMLLSVEVSAQTVGFTLNDKGLASLTYNGWQFIGDSSYQGVLGLYWGGPTFKRSDGTTYSGGGTVVGYSKDAVLQKTTVDYSWGSVSCVYSQPTSTRLNMHIVVRNNTADTLMWGNGAPSVLIFDTPIANPIATDSVFGSLGLGSQPRWVDMRRGAPALLIDLGATGTMTISNDSSPYTISSGGFLCAYNSQSRFNLNFQVGENVPAGGSADFDLSLRFAPPASKLVDVAADVYQRYTAVFPLRAQPQPDHKMMGAEFLSSTVPHPTDGKNPRGWFNNDDSIDVTTQSGLANFQSRILARADTDIVEARKYNAQGIVVWDIEGQEYPHATSYVGDPPMLDTVAPEMTYKGTHTLCVADEFFKKLSDAGLKIGVCLRPTKFTWNGSAYTQVDQPDPGQVILDKVTYCKSRWGITLFYVDSNADGNGTLPAAAIFKRALDAYPDISLMGEWQSPLQFSFGPPWDSGVNDGTNQTGSAVTDLYPGAFTNIYAADVNYTTRRSALVAGVKRGDMLMSRIWFDDPSTISAAGIYTEVGKRPTVSISSPSTNATFVSPASITVNAAAADADGSITKVEFFAGSTKIGETTTTPYSLTWTGFAPGSTYALTARATDNNGCSTVSNPVKITVAATPPAETVWGARTAAGRRDTLDYELGTVFRATVDGKVKGIRAFSTNEESGLHTARLWRNTDNALVGGPYVFVYGGENGWVTLDLPVPVGIQANVDYTVSVSTGDDTGKWYPYDAGGATAGNNGAHLVWNAGAGVIGTTLGARPTISSANANYQRDVVFEPGLPAYSLFDTFNPSGGTSGSGEYGVRMRSRVAGRITKLRYYKPSGETGTHVGRIWSAGGSQLASAQFSNETSSGWQEVDLPTPLVIARNTVYTVSVNAVSKYASASPLAGSDRFVSCGPIASPAGGPLGVTSSTPGSYPTTQSNTTHYFRDVVFEAIDSVPSYGISGSVRDYTGTGLAGLVVSTSDGTQCVTGSDGTYSFALPSGWFGSVAPTTSDFLFTPTSRPYSSVSGSLTGQDFQSLSRPGDAKQATDGAGIDCGPGIVTAKFGNSCYVENTDRSNAARIDIHAGVTPPSIGDCVRVGGSAATDQSNDERVVSATSVIKLGTGDIGALGMTNRSLYGDIPGSTAAGVDNIGVLVKVFGAITQIDPAGQYFYIDDGCGLRDGTQTGLISNTGLRIAWDGRSYGSGQFVAITGIACIFRDASYTHPRIVKPRSLGDIQPI